MDLPFTRLGFLGGAGVIVIFRGDSEFDSQETDSVK